MKPVISITFDDGNVNCHAEAFSILKNYGLRGSFYITTEQVGAPGKMDWKQVGELYDAGHEIGSHTHTHPLLTTLDDDLLEMELSKSKELLKAFNPRTIAYPCGDYDEHVINAAKKYYEAGRCFAETGPGSPNLLPFKNPFALSNTSLDGYSGIGQDREKKEWIIFVFHLYGRMTLPQVWWGITHGRFKWSTVQ
ncbi:hypothetical protein BVX97_00660, partial [bacterium E08(2017)]